ncbi:TPA: hypothetical protein DF272_05030 [Candidatus Falkowbacteria bacterium]|nr:hypothetical protein [Candidatus Falkowbacteria bacterium]
MIKKKPSICLLSSYATDQIIHSKKSSPIIRQGGPAYFLTKAFSANNISYKLPHQPNFMVEIILSQNNESGRIISAPQKINVNFNKLNSQYLVISSIFDEFNLLHIDQFKGIVFLDLQGYVRKLNCFGYKQKWLPNTKIQNSIFCLKGTTEELQYITTDHLNLQKQKILIATKGKDGCDLYYNGKKISIPPKKIISAPDTIGAGDTFFGHFISNFIKTNNPKHSVKYAMKQTSEFLNQKICSEIK